MPTTTRSEDRSENAPPAGFRVSLAIGVVVWLVLILVAGVSRAGGLSELSTAEEAEYCTLVAQETLVFPEADAGADHLEALYEDADLRLLDVEVAVCMARFGDALAQMGLVRLSLAALPETWQAQRRRAWLEVQAATVRVAMGETERARDHFRRALELDPYLDLDPQQTSPKVRQLFESARPPRLAAQ